MQLGMYVEELDCRRGPSDNGLAGSTPVAGHILEYSRPRLQCHVTNQRQTNELVIQKVKHTSPGFMICVRFCICETQCTTAGLHIAASESPNSPYGVGSPAHAMTAIAQSLAHTTSLPTSSVGGFAPLIAAVSHCVVTAGVRSNSSTVVIASTKILARRPLNMADYQGVVELHAHLGTSPTITHSYPT
jgi:hypothetical protein